MPENVNNRTTGEKVLLGFLIIVGIVSFFVGSYAIAKSIKVTHKPATTSVSAQDIERIWNVVANRLDSLHSASAKSDSIRSNILNEIKNSVDITNKELKHIEKRLIRVEKKQ